MSPFLTSNPEIAFESRFVAESQVLAINAAQKAGIIVKPVFGVFIEDLNAVSPFIKGSSICICERAKLYNHSNGETMYKVPYLNDLIQCGMKHSNHKKDLNTPPPELDYLIYTNADIILDPEFYVIIRDYILDSMPKKCVADITHKTVIVDPFDTELTLDKIRSLEGLKHPGNDCFVFPYSEAKVVISYVCMFCFVCLFFFSVSSPSFIVY